jgi:hypothetical protein
MLKSQDIVLLLKLLANLEHLNWSQQKLASHLCLSISAINMSLARLNKSELLYFGINNKRFQPVKNACNELLLFGVKYFFPVQLENYTRGIATSYAAPIFKNQISLGQNPIPVWPHAEGNQLGLALDPLYHSVPESLIQYPDPTFYDLLALVDAIRQGQTRERNLAIKLLTERLSHDTPT